MAEEAATRSTRADGVLRSAPAPERVEAPRVLVLVAASVRTFFDDAVAALRARIPGAVFSFVIPAECVPWTEGLPVAGAFAFENGRVPPIEDAGEAYDACAIVQDGPGLWTLRYRLFALRLRPRLGVFIASRGKVAGPLGRGELLGGIALRAPLLPLGIAIGIGHLLPWRMGSVVWVAVRDVAWFFAEWAILAGLIVAAFASRFTDRPVDVGIGPDPLINSPYHKKALERFGYTAQTFVRTVWHQTSAFDVRGDLAARPSLVCYYLFLIAVFRYRCLYIYFNGGPLAYTRFWRLEPWLLSLARMKIVVMPYGSDVGDMLRCPNLLLRHGYATDYPRHRFERRTVVDRVDMWTFRANHVIGGCDWVDYMFHWDTLVLAHFAIDPDQWNNVGAAPPAPSTTTARRPVRLLHAPNHRTIKGSAHFIRAVEELRNEGVDVELVIVERKPNSEIRRIMETVDIVADQLIIGWYAMFALEGMMMQKPVICYLREDLKELYIATGLLERGEIPLVSATPATIKETIRRLVLERESLPELGRRSREYALKHHSLDAIGNVFDRINRQIGLEPTRSRGIACASS